MKLKLLTIITLILAVANPASGIVLSPELGTTKAPYGVYQTRGLVVYPDWESEFIPIEEPDYSDWTIEDTRRLVRKHNLPTALVRIATCESNHNPLVINKTLNPDGSWDWGLFQINDKWWVKPLIRLEIIDEVEDLLNPDINAQAAKIIVNTRGGLNHWYCYRR